MKEFRKILCPIDLSEVSVKIIPYVTTLAGKFNSQVHILFVVSSMEHYAAFYIPHPALHEFEEELVKGARQKLQEFTAEQFKEWPAAKVEVLRGDPAEEIIKYAESAGIDLIVMGTHGRKGLEKVIFGSVADQVVKKSAVPVMTINPHRAS
ncbi:universal stress protein [Desulfoferrobacter suflitae]|uniref:universal stress protein n=1 Tax=Desulfoferrobacter suflitae TaxID=2865782 RepID=UPI002164B7A1|nr:universal stress protein [Desulfoferrobacter suflitae]MCK8603036.1 universal stress protein [Desulfoferrobacter suflitae]